MGGDHFAGGQFVQADFVASTGHASARLLSPADPLAAR